MAKTIAAVSTGNAAGGIGVIRISGDSAVQTAAKVFFCGGRHAAYRSGGLPCEVWQDPQRR